MSLLKRVEEFFANATDEDLDSIVQEVGDMELPEYHSEGMGCGIEDNRITDRYQACQYGYENAVEDCDNDVIAPLKEKLIEEAKKVALLKEELERRGKIILALQDNLPDDLICEIKRKFV